jgi:hypothetical protein
MDKHAEIIPAQADDTVVCANPKETAFCISCEKKFLIKDGIRIHKSKQ